MLPPITAICEDKDVETKDIALATMGTLRARLGDQALEKYLDKMIPAKKAKVEEAQAKWKPSKYDKSQKAEKKKVVAVETPAKKPAMKKKPALASAKPKEEKKS